MEQKSGASERRSEVSRVPTPYADITQIRFWGLRIAALSAPVGAPPPYPVVAVSVRAHLLTRERRRTATPPHVRDATLGLRRPWPLAARPSWAKWSGRPPPSWGWWAMKPPGP